LKRLKSSDAIERAGAAGASTARISPWWKATAEAKVRGSVRLFAPVRPTGRPSTGEEARRLEAALLDALDRAEIAGEREVMLESLAEVAEERGIAQLRGELERSTTREAALPVMRALETVYGLPASYEPHRLACGESGPPEVLNAEMRRHEEAEQRRFQAGRAALLAWLATNAGRPRAERVAAAFAAWDARGWIVQRDDELAGLTGSTPLRYATVVRMGNDALPELRARARKADTGATGEREAARYEILATAISGTLDEAVVRRLVASDDVFLQVDAIEIMVAAGDPRWVDTLDAWQRSTAHELALAASAGLMTLLGQEALPKLRSAAAANPENFVAKHGAEELVHR